MKRLFVSIGCATLAAFALQADELAVKKAQYLRIQDISLPVMLDSVDNSGAKFDGKSLFTIPVNVTGDLKELPLAIDPTASDALHQIVFSLENRDLARTKIKVEGADDYDIRIDGDVYRPGEEIALRPATHEVKIKLITKADSAHIVDVKLDSPHPDRFTFRNDGRRMFVHEDVMHGRRVSDVSISPDGKWVLATFTDTHKGGEKHTVRALYDTKTGNVVRRLDEALNWMPSTPLLYTTRKNIDNTRSLVSIDPATAQENVIAGSIPEGYFFMSPDERNLIYTIEVEGPKETPNGYQILEPDDRQPGWRNRSYPAVYDLKSGYYQRLTVNSRQLYATGISDDGRKLLLQSNRSRLRKRPTTVSSIYLLDLPSMRLDTLVADGEFINSCILSPDGKSVVVSASPEAFSSIGCTTDSSSVPSMIQTELYLLDAATKEVKPLTRAFDPNVQTYEWNSHDGLIYFTAENRDKISLYRLDPANGKISEIPVDEELVRQFSLSAGAQALAYRGQSASNPDGLYVLDLKKQTSKLLSRPSSVRLADVDLIKCQDWNFTNSRGDTIYGRYYLPDNFNPDKKYPVIVYYYGGCSPTSRSFDSRYPFHAYAALGYVVYVVQPSGATGFGQEFASRHVSTAGEGVAEDIIEGTKKFLAEHPFTDPEKVGCLGASYGGFMTQYLQTVTDIFAAAVSHAGISDHTSYWGEGYWGYNYSETSMGNDKPWTNPDLYVKQSPLYRADKIHTPLLFVHGDVDHNVPVGESIQLFTALKLLGQETALVQIPGEDHWILGYDNQKKWQETIFAWFAKYLKDNPDWWDTLYPPKEL